SVHLAALGLKGLRAPWAADFRDPWIALSFRMPPTTWHLERQRAMKRSVVTGADLLLAASRTHADELRAEVSEWRGDPAKALHLPNGFEPDPVEAEGARDPERFTVVFTGVLSLMPDVEVFLDAVHDLLAKRPEARRRFRARLVGPFDQTYAD